MIILTTNEKFIKLSDNLAQMHENCNAEHHPKLDYQFRMSRDQYPSSGIIGFRLKISRYLTRLLKYHKIRLHSFRPISKCSSFPVLSEILDIEAGQEISLISRVLTSFQYNSTTKLDVQILKIRFLWTLFAPRHPFFWLIVSQFTSLKWVDWIISHVNIRCEW